MEKNGWAVRGSWLMFLRERQMVSMSGWKRQAVSRMNSLKISRIRGCSQQRNTCRVGGKEEKPIDLVSLCLFPLLPWGSAALFLTNFFFRK